MLLEVIEQRFTEQHQLNIRKTIAYLTRFQFYNSDLGTSTHVLAVLSNPRACEFVRDTFQIMGYRFIHEPHLGYCGIIPGESVAESRWMTEFDTFVLLGLKHMYDKCFDQGDLDGKGNVETSFNDFCDELAQFTSPGGWEVRNPDVRAFLNKLSSTHVISLAPKLDETDDIPMKIRPFIRDVISFEALSRIEDFVRRKSGGGSEDQAIDGATDAELDSTDDDDLN